MDQEKENVQEETTEQADEREATPKNREKRAPSLWPAVIFGIIAISCWINCGQTVALVNLGAPVSTPEILADIFLPAFLTYLAIHFYKNYITYRQRNIT